MSKTMSLHKVIKCFNDDDDNYDYDDGNNYKVLTIINEISIQITENH